MWIKRWPLAFREERILREQVRLVYRNYFAGVGGFYVGTAILAVIVGTMQGDSGAYYWLVASSLVCLPPLYRGVVHGYSTHDPRVEARRQVFQLLMMGLLLGSFIIFFIDGGHPALVVMIIVFFAGLTTAGLAMQSACYPVYIAFLFPSTCGLIIGLLMQEGMVYNVIGASSTLYLLVMAAFSYNMEMTVYNAIKLRFENEGLIEKLKHAVKVADEANTQKSAFLASASHDLRQPLHAMGLFIDVLSNTNLDSEQRKIIANIQSAGSATRDMLNTFLDFSKLNAGVIQPAPKSFELQESFYKLEREFMMSADECNLILRVRETEAVVYADQTLVELVLRNIIANAIRYTHQGGVLVACRARSADQGYRIEVWDTGVGLSESDKRKVFGEFYQVANPERDQKKGFGLGLTIVKRLIEKMEGADISLDSRVAGGSVFRLELPRGRLSGDSVPRAADSDASVLVGKKVTVIEDHESVRAAIHERLVSWGCKCRSYESAEACLAEVDDYTPDLLVADYRLRRNKTGCEAIALVRECFDHYIPGIIITGDTAASKLVEVERFDAHLLHKPVSPLELEQTVSRVIAGVSKHWEENTLTVSSEGPCSNRP